MKCSFLSVFFLFVLVMRTGADIAPDNGDNNSPFWENVIEITPGHQVVLSPLLTVIKEINYDSYRLVLSLLAGMAFSALAPAQDSRILNGEIVASKNGAKGELIYKPDFTVSRNSFCLYFVFLSKERCGMGYAPVLKFYNAPERETFSTVITAPPGTVAAVMLVWKQFYEPFVGKLAIKEYFGINNSLPESRRQRMQIKP